jgi:hypothetical protein
MSNETTAVKRLFTKESTGIAKGIAILLMLFYHLFSDVQDNAIMQVNFSPIPENLFYLLAKFGNICVAIFVFLTAYGISVNLFSNENLSLKEAYKTSPKRLGKLFFSFVVMFVFVNLIWFRYFDYSLCYGAGKQGVLAFITDGLGLSHLFGTPMLNMTWWYMSIAYTLVFLVPLLAWLCKKTSYPFIGVAFLLPFILPMSNDISRYFFVMALGVVAAYGNWFEKIMNLKFPAALRFLLELGLIVLSVFVRENEFVQSHLLYAFDGLIAFVIILFAADCIGAIPVVRKVFAFLGKHSMNIFFTHTFFYLILYRDFVFRFRYAGITYLIVLACSLVLSLVLELLKTLLRLPLKLRKQKQTAQEGQS